MVGVGSSISLNAASYSAQFDELTSCSIIIARSYQDDNDYDADVGYKQPRRGYLPRDSGISTLFGLVKNPRLFGGTCLGIGVALTFMGMMLFFEGNLLRLGNILTIVGITFLIGVNNLKKFFLQESRMQAAAITAFGVFLVFWGKPRLGIICEIFGLLNLFGNMFPMLLTLGRSLPVVGDIIKAFEGGADGGGKRRAPPRRQERPSPRDREPQPRRYNPEF